jgi:hypothetical protein
MKDKPKEFEVTEHQLFISSFKHWLRLKKENKIAHSKKKMARKITLFVILSAPFRWLQSILIASRLKGISFKENPPVFVIGHWRSGTTHLHYILSQDKSFVYLDSFQAFFFRVAFVSKGIMRPLLAKLMPSTRLQDNVKIDAHSPQEEEHPLTNLTEKSGMQMFFFPKNRSYFDKYNVFEGTTEKEIKDWKKVYLKMLKQISLFQGKKKQLLLKNPHNTGRVKILLQLFPNAKFIFIHRNPYEVYSSTKYLYQKAVKTQFLQEFSEKEIEERIIYCYEKSMQKYLDDKHLIPEDSLYEISFNELETQPINSLEKMYSKLNISDFNKNKTLFKTYLETVKSYKKNQLVDIPSEVKNQINTRWKFAFENWKYELVD